MNYYNEFDSKTANWLKELIKQGLIPNGDVDTRSITEIKPHELNGYTQCHFFAGIGGWSLALQLANWDSTRHVWTGSCPCQPFSTAGKGLAQADERHLWPVFFNLIKECRPEYVFGEQVASAIGKGWLDGISTDLGEEDYTCGSAVLAASSVGAPHIRQRLYWVAYNPSAGLEGTTGAQLQGNSRGLTGCSEVDGVAYSGSEGCKRGQWSGEAGAQRAPSGHSGECGSSDESCGRGNSIMPGCEARDSIASGDESRPEQSKDSGAWSNCTIIPCRDGKTRRIPAQAIIEPVLQHVVDGFSCSLDARGNILSAAQGFPLAETIPGRVALLKGAGNAIVPQVAAEFIAASIEAIAT